ncbi:MAG: FAD-dependent oxidoreductase, partial [Coriobacteriia bacterium]|nr:FAD-dependent oxidoreductase [Coriobacteriia bacterium]
MREAVHIIGGGLAGSEAALSLAKRGVPVVLHEMKEVKKTPAHTSDNFAELVCSNSFKSEREDSAAGALKSELKMLGSELLPMIYEARVPAGGALAVDRERFSNLVTQKILTNPNIELIKEEVSSLDVSRRLIVAAGPLASEALSAHILELTGSQGLSFYDAAAPIVEADSLDMDILFSQSRYKKVEGADYLNAPF